MKPTSQFPTRKKILQSLDTTLRSGRPESKPPPGLRSAILDEVRAHRNGSRQRAEGRPWSLGLRWLPAPAFAALTLLTVWWAVHRPSLPAVHPAHSNPTPLIAVGAALHVGEDTTRTLPPAVVAPLADELGRVNLDLENTARFLLASLP